MKKRECHCCFRVMHSNPGLSGNLPDICAVGQSALIGTGILQLVPDGGHFFARQGSASTV
jgi:hypothetical protein